MSIRTFIYLFWINRTKKYTWNLFFFCLIMEENQTIEAIACDKGN